MSIFKSMFCSLIAGSCICLSVAAWADTPAQTSTQNNAAMNPPSALQNKVFDAMVGEWKGDANMMGQKIREKIKIKWGLDHQFLFIKLEGKGITDPNMKYKGLGIFGVDQHGKLKTWWFDSWGAQSVSTGEGTFTDNGLTMQDGNAMFKETRSFVVDGNTMTMHAKGTMKWQGKETPFDETTVYKKD